MKTILKKRDKKMNPKKGVSLITLVITIVVIILLAAIAIISNWGTADQTAVAEYRNELKGIEVGVASARALNQREGIGEEYKEAGFYKAYIENPPNDFVSFGSGEYYGYVVDLRKIGEMGTKKGKEYMAYQDTEDDPRMITFGEKGTNNDVYVYDATGKVYYAKGLYTSGGVYYSDILTVDGPIITVARLPIEAEDGTIKEVKLTIQVEPEEAGSAVTLRIDNELQTPNGEGEYEFTATRNGIYCVTAEEGVQRSAMKNVPVTEIKEKDYIITYYLNDEGNRVETQTKYANSTARLKGFSREGYILVGWSKDESALVSSYLPGSIYEENSDIELYAMWEEGIPKEYTVSFNANGGANAPEPITKMQGQEIQLPSEMPSRTGYSFAGWSTKSDNKQVDYLPEGSYAEDKDIMLYAVWTIGDTELKIEFNPAGAGTAIGAGIKNKNENVYVTALPNPGYEFEKWTVKTGSIPVEFTNPYSATTRLTMPAGTVTIVANFKSVSYDYQIQYDANGGTGAPQPQQKKRGVNINLSTATPRKSGQEFAGWSDTAAAKIPKYQPGDVYNEDKSVTLYAVWSQNTTKYTLTFDANGGVDAPASITRPSNSIVTIPPQIPTRSNLIFIGWDENRESKEATYVKGSELILDRNMTLYAIWRDTDRPVAHITATEESGELVLIGNAVDNGGVTHYAWANDFYKEENKNSIPWVALNNPRLELTVKKDVIRAGLHYFYVKDADNNYAYSSIEVYKMDFKSEGVIVDTKYKASGYSASLSRVIPKRARYVFAKWKSEGENRVYEEGEMYLLNHNEIFHATWNDAIAWIPSQDEYFLSANDAAKTISLAGGEYTLIELLKNDSVPFQIASGQNVSFDTDTFKLEVAGNAIAVASGAKFRLVSGDIKATEFAIRNQGETELLAGTIRGNYGVSNSGTLTLGDVSKTYSKNSVIVEGTTQSYQKATPDAVLKLQNGCFIDRTNAVPESNVTTVRSVFVYRAIDKGTQKVTTITEDIIFNSQITVGTEEKALERRVTIQSEITARDSDSRIEYAIDAGAYQVGNTVSEIRDNCTIRAKTIDNDGIAAQKTYQITDIKELTIHFKVNSPNGTVSPDSQKVKYMRKYNYYGDFPTPQRDYYRFLGWYDDSGDAGNIVNSGDIVRVTDDQDLYAHWIGRDVTVTFNPNGGALSTSQRTITVQYQGKYSKLLECNERTNYTFLGWYDRNNRPVESGDTVTNPEDHTLTAKWELQNRAPTVTGSVTTKSTSSLTIRMKGSDEDGDKLRYRLYMDGTKKKEEENVTQGSERTYTFNSLGEYTSHSIRLEVYDGIETGTYSFDARTYCSGYCKDTVSCHGEEQYEYVCSKCHGRKTCDGSISTSGSPQSWPCYNPYEGGTAHIKSRNGNGGIEYCYATAGTIQYYSCSNCSATGLCITCNTCSVKTSYRAPTTFETSHDCSSCGGTGEGDEKVATGYGPCSRHGKSGYHYYCTSNNHNYIGYSSTHTPCKHGFSTQH